MNYSFDVLKDKWINVQNTDGNIEKVSVIELLENAHNYKCISENTIFEEYGEYQFLTAFLLSALYLKTLKDKKDLLIQGHFDMIKIFKYIEQCEFNRPNCFNLFGDNPFYQNKYVKELGVKENTVSKMDLYAPAGRNSLHFFSEFYIGRSLTFEECAKILCSYLLFQPEYDGGNTSSGPNGQFHPIYFLIEGENLFETLILNLIVEASWIHSDNYIGNAAWETEPTKNKKEVKTLVTLTEGLTFLNRAVLLVPNKDLTVSNIYITAGYDYKGEGFWEQPNCSYYMTKKGTKTHLKMSKERVWMDLNKFFDKDLSNRIKIFSEYYTMCYELGIEDLLSTNIKYSIYYNTCKEGNQSPILKSGKYSSSISWNLLNDSDRIELLNDFIETFNRISNILFITDEYLVLNRKGVEKEKFLLQGKNKETFFDSIEFEILPQYLYELDLLNIEDGNEQTLFINKYNQKLKDLAIKSIEDSLYSFDMIGNDSFYKLVKQKNILISKINNTIDIGGIKDES